MEQNSCTNYPGAPIIPESRIKLLDSELSDEHERMNGFRVRRIPRRKRSDTPKKPNIPSRYPKSFLKGKGIMTSRDNYGSCSSFREENPPLPEDSNYCAACDVSFRYDNHYAKHCVKMHGKAKPYSCRYCRQSYTRKHNLIKHVNREHADQKYPRARWKKQEPVYCRICRVNVEGFMAFEQHARILHEGIPMVECPHCPRKFMHRTSTVAHIKQKHNKKNFELLRCNFCKRVFKRTDVLKSHEEFCELRQSGKKFLKETHEKVDSDAADEIVSFPCEECGKEFGSFKHLEHHCRHYHSEVKWHTCEYCEETFFNRIYKEKHVDLRHADEPAVVEMKKMRKGVPVHNCEYCNKPFSGIMKYERHAAAHHPGLFIFHCGKCQKGFFHKATLRNHLQENHGELKTRCSYCSKCFYWLHGLRKHEAACKKKCDRRERLRKEGVRAFYCEICQEDLFIKKKSVKCHMKRHEEYVNCEVCKEGFHRYRNPNGLALHMQMRHPLHENIKALLESTAEFKNVKKEQLEGRVKQSESKLEK